MVWAMGSLSVAHIYRMILDYGGYQLDFTGYVSVCRGYVCVCSLCVGDGRHWV